MILFQQPFLTIEYDENRQCLIQNWKGFAKSEQFREGITKSVEISKRKKVTRLISNTKDFALVKKEDTDWAAESATPQLVKNGLQQMAFIVPTSAFAKLSVDNFTQQTAGSLRIQFFDEFGNALTWFDGK